MNYEGIADEELSPTFTRRGAIVATAGGLLTTSLYPTPATAQDDSRQLWTFEANDSISTSPTVVDGTVFVGSGDDDDNLYAVDAETGEQQWGFNTGDAIYSSPTVVDGTVFVGSNDGVPNDKNLFAVDAETGEQQWVFREAVNDVTSSPTVVDETVFVGSWDSNFYAVDAVTGNQQWVFETDREVMSSPTVVDGTVFVGSWDSNLYAVDAKTGEQQWTFETGRSFDSSPTVADGKVFIGSDNSLYAIDAESGEQQWSTFAGGISWSSPTVADGTVFVGNRDRHLYAVNAETGKQQWSFGTDNRYVSSPTVVNETVFVGSANNLYAVDAETGEQKWAFEDDYRFGSPTVVNGTVFVGSGNKLYALDADVSGSSDGSSVRLGTDGHHGDWRYAGQSIDIPDSQNSSESQDIISTEALGISALGTVTTIAGGYGFYRWKSGGSDRQSKQNHQKQPQTDEPVVETTEEADTSGPGDDTQTKPTTPETIPSTPRMSLSYDKIERGKLLGSGGNADVYRATTTSESVEVPLAIKEPRMAGETVDTDTIENMLEEAETWQQLDDHDYIVSVVDFGSTPLPWIGMEYMDGDDLNKRTGDLSFEQALWTALAITKGVRYAHKRGVAHLDLKPSNILFRSVENAWDVPKVADWGLSKHLLEHSQSVEGMSPRYAAPEQLDSEQFGQTDTVTDVYQLGTVLYELFTGDPPFKGETYEVMNKIQSTTPVPPSDKANLPVVIDDILLKALATERTERYDDVLYIRDSLQDLWKEKR